LVSLRADSTLFLVPFFPLCRKTRFLLGSRSPPSKLCPPSDSLGPSPCRIFFPVVKNLFVASAFCPGRFKLCNFLQGPGGSKSRRFCQMDGGTYRSLFFLRRKWLFIRTFSSHHHRRGPGRLKELFLLLRLRCLFARTLSSFSYQLIDTDLLLVPLDSMRIRFFSHGNCSFPERIPSNGDRFVPLATSCPLGDAWSPAIKA